MRAPRGCALLAALCLALWLVAAPAVGAPGVQVRDFVEETLSIPSFGKVKVYRPLPLDRTRGVVLFVSGDGGWGHGVVDMARRSASRTIVAGLSMPAWKKAAQKDPRHCWFPAGELEATAQAIEKYYHLPHYIRPILVGYSSGATAVYGALAQAPAESFAGAISLGFCAEMEVARPLCSQDGWKPVYDPLRKTSLLPPRADLATRADGSARWIALHGLVDQVCEPRSVGGFTARIPAARLISLPKVGHGFSVSRNWGAAYDTALEGLLETASPWERPRSEARLSESRLPNHSPAEIRARLDALDLPLEVQWLDGATVALVFVSGDGGWAELDQSIASALAAHGVGVVGWNTLRYFWAPHSPEEFRADLAKVIDALPETIPVYAGGFSFGAEVVPVCLDATPRGEGSGLSRIAGLVLVGPGRYASFEVSPLDWIRSASPITEHPVGAALARLKGLPVLCLEASQHADSGCPPAPLPGLERVTMPGGHHFDGDYEGLASRVLAFLKREPPG